MKNSTDRLYFASDYMEGTHPAILSRLTETNMEKTIGYYFKPLSQFLSQFQIEKIKRIRETASLLASRTLFYRG